MHSTTVDFEPAALSDEQLSHLYPVVYSTLRTDHRHIIEEATGDGTYEACPPVSEATETFVALAKERIDRQWKDYGGSPETRPEYLQKAYLERDGEYFELRIAVEDMVLS